jgi:decaprenyl-phosphate phosphoribosyltransferase
MTIAPSALLRLLRPHQWLKNAFVFAGLLFGHAWAQSAVVERVLWAFAAFCCASSLVYIINDWRDCHVDAQHPLKRHRPLASGAVSLPVAAALGAVLAVLAVLCAWDQSRLLTLLAIYVLINLAYSWRLKHVPVVDVFSIATGFMLRLLAGTVAVGIPPSRWLLLAGLFLALFLGFSKRKAETFHAPGQQRAVLEHYPAALLDTCMSSTLTASVITYGLYATSVEALQQHGSGLIYTVPVVVFGLLRYAYQVHRGRGEDVARDLVRDPWLLASGVAWGLIFVGTSLGR